MSTRVHSHNEAHRKRPAVATVSALFTQAEQAASHLFDSDAARGQPGSVAAWLPTQQDGSGLPLLAVDTDRAR